MAADLPHSRAKRADVLVGTHHLFGVGRVVEPVGRPLGPRPQRRTPQSKTGAHEQLAIALPGIIRRVVARGLIYANCAVGLANGWVINGVRTRNYYQRATAPRLLA